MKTIRVSDEVWNAIAAKGKFGETEDIVLRRVFGLQPEGTLPDAQPQSEAALKAYGWKERRTETRMYQSVRGGKLILEFEPGQRMEWNLPGKQDATGIRKVRDEAIDWVRKQGETDGQVAAAMRALTSRGYHVTLKGHREYA